MPEIETDILVIGAGPTGMAAAWKLARAGRRVVVVDADAEPGGLCRTLTWGELRFDVGGHRFHTAYPDVHAMVTEVAGDELIAVARRSRIHLGGRRFLHFPPAVGDTLANVPRVGLAAGLHSLWGALVGVDPEPPPDLRAYLHRQFGGALYDLVFGDYTEKVWGLRPEHISPDWGAARVGGLSLTGLLRQALGLGRGGARSVELFLYPRDGYGRIFHRLAEDVEAHGGQVRCGHRVTRVTAGGGRPVVTCATAEGEVRLAARRVLSTMPLAPMVELLDPPPPADALAACRQLAYRALCLVVLDLDGDAPISDDTWLYFPHASTAFCRLHEPTNWSRALAPAGRSHVVVEYFCAVDDPIWARPDQALADEVAAGLAAAGLLDRGRVRASRVLRYARAYPIYDAAYAETLARVEAELDARPGLLRAGRAGAFLYLSSDECMRHGLVAAERLLHADPPAHPAAPGEELVLLCAPGLEPEPDAVARLARALERRAADLASGCLLGADATTALVRADQLRAPERLPFPGLCLVRRSAWLAAGGEGVPPQAPAAAAVLARLAADPARVLVREPRAAARATPAWWAALPAGRERHAALGVEPPDLRRRAASLSLWGLVASLGAAAAACNGPGPGLLAPIPALFALLWLLAGLPGWATLLRARRLSVAAILARELRFR